MKNLNNDELYEKTRNYTKSQIEIKLEEAENRVIKQKRKREDKKSTY